jgi:hypothetical protein
VLPHPLDIVYLILGVLFSLRQLDTSMRRATSYPNTTEADFERWKRTAVIAYRIGAWSCFGKVLLDIVLAYAFRSLLPPVVLMRTVGIALDVGTVALIVYAIVRIRRSRVLAREVGTEAVPARRAPSSEP